MDDRLKKALEISDLMVTLNNTKRILKEQYAEKLQYYQNGGRFVVTRDIITFVKTLIDLNQISAVIIDVDGEPVSIDDLQTFLNTIVSIYTEASNFYIVEYQKLIKNRTIDGILDIWAKVFCL